MFALMKMINSHQGWDRHMPPPRGGGRHATEIAGLWTAYAKCQRMYADKNCENCEKDAEGAETNCQSIPVAETVAVAGTTYVIWKVLKTCGCGALAGPVGAGVCFVTP